MYPGSCVQRYRRFPFEFPSNLTVYRLRRPDRHQSMQAIAQPPEPFARQTIRERMKLFQSALAFGRTPSGHVGIVQFKASTFSEIAF